MDNIINKLSEAYAVSHMSTDELILEAIATINNYLEYISEDELMNRSRPLAVALVALSKVKDDS